MVQARAEFTFIYQQHRCDHYNSSSPTQQDMEGECGGGKRGQKVEKIKGEIAERVVTDALS